MSTSSVSFSPGLSQSGSQIAESQLQQGFKQLSSSLGSGDISAARKAFSNLQRLLQINQYDSPGATVASARSSPIQQDFAALSQALNSGDLSAAQSDFSKLQSDLKTPSQNSASGSAQGAGHVHHGHHHRHASSDADAADSPSTSTIDAESQSPAVGSTVSFYA